MFQGQIKVIKGFGNVTFIHYFETPECSKCNHDVVLQFLKLFHQTLERLCHHQLL